MDKAKIVDAIQHLAGFVETEAGYDANNPEIVESWKTIIEALVGEGSPDGGSPVGSPVVPAEVDPKQNPPLLVFDEECYAYILRVSCPYFEDYIGGIPKRCQKYNVELTERNRCDACKKEFPEGLELRGMK